MAKRNVFSGASLLAAAALILGFQNCGSAFQSAGDSSPSSDAARLTAISKSADEIQTRLYAAESRSGETASALPIGSLPDIQNQLQALLEQAQRIQGNTGSPDISNIATQVQSRISSLLSHLQSAQLPSQASLLTGLPSGDLSQFTGGARP